MDIYTKKHKKNINISKYFKNNNICFLDIETTGFSRKKNIVYLVGCMYPKNNYWIVKQFFANSRDEEQNLISALANFLETFDTIVTYNGDNFDLNFLNQKFQKYNIKYSFSKNDSFDIYRNIKKENIFLNLDNLKLKSIEEFIGIYRKDTLDGKDCIKSYYNFLSTNDVKYKNLILQHNYEDLIYLPKILKIFDIIDKKKIITLYLKDSIVNIELKNINIDEDILKIKCICPIVNTEPIIHYENNYNLQWQPNNNFLSIDIEIKKGLLSTEKDCFYITIINNSLKINIKDTSEYNLPQNIIPIKIDKNFQIENIKCVVKNIIEYNLNNNLI